MARMGGEWYTHTSLWSSQWQTSLCPSHQRGICINSTWTCWLFLQQPRLIWLIPEDIWLQIDKMSYNIIGTRKWGCCIHKFICGLICQPWNSVLPSHTSTMGDLHLHTTQGSFDLQVKSQPLLHRICYTLMDSKIDLPDTPPPLLLTLTQEYPM